MPVAIYKRTDGKENETVGWLCDGSWDLAEQMYALEEWLKTEAKKLERGDYVADVGICVRTDFERGVGGGAAFPPEAMAVMAQKGIALFLSEYPRDSNEKRG